MNWKSYIGKQQLSVPANWIRSAKPLRPVSSRGRLHVGKGVPNVRPRCRERNRREEPVQPNATRSMKGWRNGWTTTQSLRTITLPGRPKEPWWTGGCLPRLCRTVRTSNNQKPAIPAAPTLEIILALTLPCGKSRRRSLTAGIR